MTKRLTIDFEEDFHKEFSKKCIEEEVNKAEIIRELVKDWVNEEDE